MMELRDSQMKIINEGEQSETPEESMRHHNNHMNPKDNSFGATANEL